MKINDKSDEIEIDHFTKEKSGRKETIDITEWKSIIQGNKEM
jgi:hypothetical protein